MATEFVEVPGGTFLVEGWEHTPAQLRADLAEFVATWEGIDEFEAETIVSRVTFARTWYTEAGGFTHDCEQHLPEETTDLCRGSREVVSVNGLTRPEVMREFSGPSS